ncbi:hypothetical protein GJAV_G00035840, partial [Gymnothorax javanicus]
MELPNHAKQVLLQLNQQRAKGFLCDVIIVVENALFRAHKNILAASSIYFKSLVLHDNLINLDTEMVNPSVFRQILDFIYTGKLLSSSDQTSDQNFNALLTAASYLQLHDLAALCRKKLKRNGRMLPAKSCTPNVGRPLRTQRLSAAAALVGQKNFPGSDCENKPPDDGLLKDKLSDDELFVGGGLQPGSGKNNSNGDLSSGSGGDQELGLDLSKKSPSDSTATEEVSPNSLPQGSPHSGSASSANSASFEDSMPNPQGLDGVEPMDVAGGEEKNQNHTPPEAGQPHKSSRQVARKKEWPKKEAGLAKGGEERSLVPNGVIVGPKPGECHSGSSAGGSFTSEHSFQCKEEEEGENGQDHSEESGQSD